MKMRKRMVKLGPFLAAIAVFTKSAKIIAALKLFKFGKPLVTAVSLLISAVLYGIWLGPWFGIGPKSFFF